MTPLMIWLTVAYLLIGMAFARHLRDTGWAFVITTLGWLPLLLCLFLAAPILRTFDDDDPE